THKITQADLDSGSFADTGSVTSEGGTKAEDKDKVEADQKPKLGLTKKDDLNPAKYDHVGQVVTYTLVATNEGNTTLHKVEVSDSPALEGFSCTPSIPVASLAPEGKVECTGTHKITQADLDSGSFADTGSVTSEGGTKAEDKDKVEAHQRPQPRQTNSPHPTIFRAADQVINYPLVATNESNVPLHSVSISDPTLGTLSCTPSIPVASLAPKGTISCTGSYTIKTGDIKSPPTGEVVNTATAKGLDPQNHSVSAQAKATVKQVAETGKITPR